jgi:hypothetical protein
MLRKIGGAELFQKTPSVVDEETYNPLNPSIELRRNW